MKLVFYGLLVAGFVACQVFGIGRTLERVDGSWTAWPMVAGVVLGVAILALTAAFAFRVPVPVLGSDGAMVFVLAVLIGCKVVVSLASVVVYPA